MSVSSPLPPWAAGVASLYQSHAASQFILHGNVQDALLLPGPDQPHLATLEDYLLAVLIPQFEVVLTYDLGGGLRIARGASRFAAWPSAPSSLPRAPPAALDGDALADAPSSRSVDWRGSAAGTSSWRVDAMPRPLPATTTASAPRGCRGWSAWTRSRRTA